MGEGASWLDPNLVHNASAAVLHYFKQELSRDFVSVSEFALALEKVLRGFGLSVFADSNAASAPVAEKCIVESNLQELAGVAGKGFELVFFPHLREEVRAKMEQSPHVLRFHGLRPCVKQLAGSERWSRRCQNLSDQIVEYLRSCWQTERTAQSCALVVL
jgi:hypothetical protein